MRFNWQQNGFQAPPVLVVATGAERLRCLLNGGTCCSSVRSLQSL